MTIRLEAAAATQLRTSVLDYLSPFIQPAAGVPLLNRSQLESRLDHILRDHRSDPIEAPIFFDAVSSAAGGDSFLSAHEVPQVLRQLSNISAELIPGIFRETPDHRDQVIATLDACQNGIKGLLFIVAAYKNGYADEEQSHFTILNHENAWGVAVLLNGETESSSRYRAAARFSSDLSDMLMGAMILRDSLQEFYFPENNAYVQKFISGPFGRSIRINQMLASAAFAAMAPGSREDPRAFAESLLPLALHHGATELAIRLGNQLREVVGDEFIEQLLPGKARQIWEVGGRAVVNDLLSLPSMFSYLAGFGALNAVARTARGSAALSRAATVMGRGRALLPGFSIFESVSTAASWRLSPFTRFFVSMSAEFAKGNMVVFLGKSMGGDTGGHIAGLLYMGGVGAVAGYTTHWLSRLAAELRAVDTNGVVASWIKAGMPVSDDLSMAYTLAAYEGRSLRLTTLGDITVTRRRIGELRQAIIDENARAIERAAAEARMQEAQRVAGERLASAVTAASRFAAKKFQDPDAAARFLAKIQQLTAVADISQIPAARDAIYAAMREASTAIKTAAAEAIKSAPAPVRRVVHATPTSLPAVGPKNFVPRTDRMAQHAAEAAERTPPHAEPAVSVAGPAEAGPQTTPPRGTPAVHPTQQVLDNPPRFLTDDVLRTMTSDRIQFQSGVLSDIREFYAGTPKQRRAILRRLAELAGQYGEMRGNWTTITSSGGQCVRGKVGNHRRILARPLGEGKWEIYKFDVRGHLNGMGTWSPTK